MSKNKKNIFLIGPMGAGKTSVGKILSELTHRPFYDSDQEVENRTGVDVSWIFAQEGESGFRKREAEIIAELTGTDGIILSTGGGSVTTASNRLHLAENGIVVYLSVSIEKQINRVSIRKNVRPLLDVYNTKEKLIELNAKREPHYRAIADFSYQTDTLHPRELANRILNDIESSS